MKILQRLFLILIVSNILLVWILWPKIMQWLFTVETDNLGTFGDMFGSINALFSGLAFVGIIYTVILQSKELELQREELGSTRFENTFFQLLRFYNEVVDANCIDQSNPIFGSGIRTRVGKTEYKYETIRNTGRKAIAINYDDFKMWVARGGESDINKNYSNFSKLGTNKIYLENYFKIVYNLLKVIDKSRVEDKQYYADLLKSMMSDHELAFIYYYNKDNLNKEQKELMQEYKITEQPPNYLLIPDI